MAQNKLDIFRVLGNINKKNKTFYQSLPDDEKKAFVPLVTMRWMTGTANPIQIFYINELVNPFIFSFYKHPELLYDLMVTCVNSPPSRYKWKKQKSRKSSKTPNTISVIRDYYGYNSVHAAEALVLLSDDDVLQYADQLGRQPDVIKTIKKELKARAKS